jgi:hypothetical protein
MAHAVPEKKHAVLGPSGWDTWGNCPGSVPLGADIPNESSRYAREGTAAHQLLEDCLVGGLDAEDLIGREYEVEGESFVVDMDMAEAVDAALNYIRDTVKPERGDVLMTEASVPLQFMTGEEGAEGTSDVLAIVDGGKTMIVMDYKHGQGVKVWASERRELIDGSQELPNPNGQMAMYALGRLHEIGFVYDEIETVKLVILQPRMEQIDEFEMPLAELQAFGQQVELAAAKVDMARLAFEQGEDIELNPTEKGCKFCKAKPRCPALRNMTSSALSIVSDAEDFDNLTLPKKASSVAVGGDTPAEKLAEFMRAIPMIEEACKSVRGEVERRLLAGQQVPGYYLGVGRAQGADQERPAQDERGDNRQDHQPNASGKALEEPLGMEQDRSFDRDAARWAERLQGGGQEPAVQAAHVRGRRLRQPRSGRRQGGTARRRQ